MPSQKRTGAHDGGGQENFCSPKAAAVVWVAFQQDGGTNAGLDEHSRVQVGKVRLVAGGMDVDPKTDRDTQILLALRGKRFEKMPVDIGVVQLETPLQLTAEEVAEQLMVWLKEREQADEYARPNIRTEKTTQRNWTPQRNRQVAVQSPEVVDDEN